MAERTRLITMDEGLGLHGAKLEEINEGLSKTRDEFTHKFDGIEGSIAELKQMLLGLQNSRKDERSVVIQIDETGSEGVMDNSTTKQAVNKLPTSGNFTNSSSSIPMLNIPHTQQARITTAYSPHFSATTASPANQNQNNQLFIPLQNQIPYLNQTPTYAHSNYNSLSSPNSHAKYEPQNFHPIPKFSTDRFSEVSEIGCRRGKIKDRLTLVERISEHEINWIDVRCEPVIDVLHAQFNPQIPPKSLEVFGYIKVMDIEGSENCPLFDRQQFQSPQRLHPCSPLGNYLQLQGPDHVPNFIDPRVFVNIKNVDTGDVVAHGVQRLLKSTHTASKSDDEFEKLYTLQFQGAKSGDLVELQCVAFTFGVYAKVHVFLYNDIYAPKIDQDEDQQLGVDVFGLIYAQCNPLHLPKHTYKNHMFTVVKQESEWVALGGQLGLYKSLVAMPAYSELEITLDLQDFDDDESIVQGTVCFRPGNFQYNRKEVQGKNGYYAKVHVQWWEPSLLNRPWGEKDTIEGFREMPHSPGSYALHLVEVFSLFIARPNGKEVNLYGSVSIYGANGWCNIFSRSKEEAYFLPSGCNLLPMQGPDSVVRPGMSFVVAVDLSDVDGHVKINGTTISSHGIEERQRPWFDRRLCSVVRSEEEKSFVAIHHTLFSFAIPAIVTVRLEYQGKSFDHVKVYGDIIASYDKLSYPTSYDKQFFRRVLFTRKEANSLKVEENFVLLRSLVAVPLTYSLLAEVKLSFQTEKGTYSVAEIVKFQIGDSTIVSITSDVVDIRLDVDWKGLV